MEKQQRLSNDKRAQLREIQYLLAICAFHQEPTTEAETALLEVTRLSQPSEPEALRICHARHLLCQLYLRRGHLSSALRHCEKAVRGYQKILGKQHNDYFDSLVLLTKTYQANGNDARASACLHMLPEKYRTKCQTQTPSNARWQQKVPLKPWKSPVPSSKRVDTKTRSEWLANLQIQLDNDLLRNAVFESDDAVVNRIISADPASVNRASNPRPDGLTALHLASLFNEMAIAETLINKGASIEAVCSRSPDDLRRQDYRGLFTPLDLACEFHQHDSIRLLVGRGASLKAYERGPRSYYTSLRKSAVAFVLNGLDIEDEFRKPQNVVATLETLLSLGWNIDEEVEDGRAMLHVVVRRCWGARSMEGLAVPLVRFLLGSGAKVNATDAYGYTPLHYAAMSATTEVLEPLLRGGAEVNAQNPGGYTPLHYLFNWRLSPSKEKLSAIRYIAQRNKSGGEAANLVRECAKKRIASKPSVRIQRR